MRKLLFLFAVLSAALTMQANAPRTPKKVYISKLNSTEIKPIRTPDPEEILCYYYESDGTIESKALTDLEILEVTVTNTSTGGVWSDSFDSSQEPPHLLPVSNDTGSYIVVYTTESGDNYEGTFDVGGGLGVIVYMYDLAGNRISRSI